MMNFEVLESRFTRRPHSPLFARLAESYLEVGKLAEAKRLCLQGIQNYPGYVSGRLLLAKCYVAEGDLEEAGRIIERIREQYPHSQVLKNLLIEWSSLAFVPAQEESDVPVFAEGTDPVSDISFDASLPEPIAVEDPSPPEIAPAVSPVDEIPTIVAPVDQSENSSRLVEQIFNAFRIGDAATPSESTAENTTHGDDAESFTGADTAELQPPADNAGLDSGVNATAGQVEEPAVAHEDADDYFRSMLEDVSEGFPSDDEADAIDAIIEIPGSSGDAGMLGDSGIIPPIVPPIPPPQESMIVEFTHQDEPARVDDVSDHVMEVSIPLLEIAPAGAGTRDAEPPPLSEPDAYQGEEVSEYPIAAVPESTDALESLEVSQTPPIAEPSSEPVILARETEETAEIHDGLMHAPAPLTDASPSEVDLPPAVEKSVDAGVFIPPEFQHDGIDEKERRTGTRSEVNIRMPEEEGERIVSRTLAQIYEAQGEYEEALITYKLLRKRRPDLSGVLDNKISELASLIESRLTQ